jgi:hypothetical protein
MTAIYSPKPLRRCEISDQRETPLDFPGQFGFGNAYRPANVIFFRRGKINFIDPTN